MNKILIVMILLTNLAVARMGSEPPSQRYNTLTKQEMELYQLKPVDVPQLLQKNIPKDYDPKPVTFAVGNTTNINLKSHGTWTDVPGGQIWNLRFKSKNATDINFGFTNFYLPEGVELYFMSFADDPVYYDGPYTSSDNQSYKQFWSAPLPGGDVALELFVPTGGTTDQIELGLTKVSTGFRDVFKRYNGDGLIPKQGPCNNDVVCPVGDDWRDDIRSVAAYTMGGTDTCTGTMVMDADRSFTPYFLTADHCGVRDANAATMVTIWNFESINCGDLSGGSRLDTVNGAIFKATRSDVDFTLVELASAPPFAFGVYWAGWDRSGAVPTGSVGIHHPGVDEKAISFNTDALTTVNSCIGAGVDTHWEVDNWESGTTEPGSSGSGLWDPDTKLLVGFLSGGIASCTNIGFDCYGKVSEAWDDGSGVVSNLNTWLDPSNTGLTSIAGSDPKPFGLTADDMAIEVCSGDTGAGSTVNVSTDGIFIGAVTLTAPTTPAFVSNFAFATTPIDPTPGSSAFTFDVAAGGTTGTHTLVLQGDGDDAGTPISATVSINLIYSGGATAATTLATPLDAATDVPVATTFSWAADANATSYHLMVSDDPAFGTLLIDEFLTDTSFDATGLPGDTQLHWKVATISSSCGSHVESDVFTFTTNEVFCATVPVAIPDLPPGIGIPPVPVDLTIPVTLGGSLASLTASIKSDHTWPGDLIFTLTNNGTSVILMDRPGVPALGAVGCREDGVDAVFDDTSAVPVEDVCEDTPPTGIVGTLAPEQALSAFAGADFSGDWVLTVTDNARLDTGSITEFCLVPTLGGGTDLIFANGFE
ncbi:MAG: hypothetical protein L3J53_01225 [Proteobacteria bacterium]|nr:hypothetical protein [Pseudomonadota bacterium]